MMINGMVDVAEVKRSPFFGARISIATDRIACWDTWKFAAMMSLNEFGLQCLPL